VNSLRSQHYTILNVLFIAALVPVAVLPVPLVYINARLPNAVLSLPGAFSLKASFPTAVLDHAVVFFCKAYVSDSGVPLSGSITCHGRISNCYISAGSVAACASSYFGVEFTVISLLNVLSPAKD